MKTPAHFTTQQITAQETYPVRHAVLRTGKPIETCAFNGDDLTTTIHLGLFREKAIVGVLSFMKTDNDVFTITQQYQLRGMAIDKLYQGKGLGNLLLNAGEQILKAKNVDLIWCNARRIATNFYNRNGYKTVGDAFEIPEIGLHYIMYKNL